MVKKIFILLLAIVGIGFMLSCSDYLNSEKYFKDRLTLEKHSKARIMWKSG